MRAFIAITPPETVQAAVAQLAHELNRSHADVRWVPAHQLHLTLKFLEDLSDPQRDAVIAMLEQMATRQAPFRVQVGGLGGFPTLRAPRVLWVGIEDGQEQLVRMAHAIEQQVRALGLPPEPRPYAAHLTIGRVRSPKGLGGLQERAASMKWQAPEAWTVDRITLYQSVLGSGGARHIALAEALLSEKEVR